MRTLLSLCFVLYLYPADAMRISLLLLLLLFALAIPRPSLDAQVRLNEIMAASHVVFEDPQEPGEFPDWIELYNASDTAADIGGWHLSDDRESPRKFELPSPLRLAPGAYLIVIADSNPEQGALHTNFRIDSGGEAILLTDETGQLVDAVTLRRQPDGESFGRSPDGSPLWGHMTQPSPGARNRGARSPIVEFSRPGGSFVDSIEVELSSRNAGADLYYTTDGDEPTRANGTLYSGPIEITETTWLRTRAYEDGLDPSLVESTVFMHLHSELREFDSSLPLVIVDTMGFDIHRESEPGEPRPLRPTLSVFVDTAEQSGRASLTGPAEYAGFSGMRVRGQSTSQYPKKQYALETWSDDREDRAVSLLGFPRESDWVLQAPYSDKTLMRNHLMYSWSREIGRYAARTRFVEVFVNRNGGSIRESDYAGVYVFMEKIKRDRNRVDIARLDPSDSEEPEINGGYLLKKDWYGGESFFTTQRLRDSFIYSDPDTAELTSGQKTWIQDYFNTAEAALVSTQFDDPKTGYEQYIDVPSFIDHHLLVELARNVDGFVLSTYIYKDRGGRIKMGPIWDYNGSLGGADYFCSYETDGWHHRFDGRNCGEGGESFPADNPNGYRWYDRLFDDEVFRLRYADRWFELREDSFRTDELLADVDAAVEIVTEGGADDSPMERNFEEWNILNRYVWPNAFVGGDYADQVGWMTNWLRGRVAWMDEAVAEEYGATPPNVLVVAELSNRDRIVSRGDTVSLERPEGTRGTIYYTTDGSDPRQFSGGDDSSNVLLTEDAPKRVSVPTEADAGDRTWREREFDDAAWNSGTTIEGRIGGVGFDTRDRYADFISIDVEDEMHNVNPTCYVRIPFDLDADAIENARVLTLLVRNDDGFVAWINGIEVARAFAPLDLDWNSRATSSLGRSDFQEFDISAHRDALRTGENVLAIHAMNFRDTSSDFLISAQIVASSSAAGGPSADSIEYREDFEVDQTIHIRARAYDTDRQRWSAAQDVSLVPDLPVTISEIMYHPAAPPAGSQWADDDFEFIEFFNYGDGDANLSSLRLVDGVRFEFPAGTVLAPGAYLVVARNLEAFAERYPGIPALGPYDGQLDNDGDRVSLVADLQTFRVDDAWYPSTDGDGPSLVRIDPSRTDADLNLPSAWRASERPLGSPGESDESRKGGRQTLGDCNGDGSLDVSDPVCTLIVLFLGGANPLPCGDGELSEPGNTALLDWQGDGSVNISDVVSSLNFLFRAGTEHSLFFAGRGECVPVPGCDDHPSCN
ncbi:MAG: CotH kinase family protein [Planctomycetota bacterium]